MASLPHAAATFLGAFLVFFCQPMMGRFLLPRFGGGAAVWSVVLAFFQTALVVGYGYAHGLQRLPHRLQAQVHLLLLSLATVSASIVPEAGPADSTAPAREVLEALTCSIGLPFVLLAATAPLVQRWLVAVRPERSPYGLYALSNVGALLALVAYPWIELQAPRALQARFWRIGLGLLTVMLALAAPWGNKGRPGPSRSAGRFRLRWFLLPALSSALLLATTDRLTANVPPIPFLWTLPLGLYLITFVLAFARGGLAPRLPAVLACMVLAPFAVRELGEHSPPFGRHLVLLCATLAALTLFLHGELFRSRPLESNLTRYYLAIAAGGATGGLSVALLCPVLFDSYVELPLLLAGAGLWGLASFARDPSSRVSWRRLAGGWRARAGALLPWVLWGWIATQLVFQEMSKRRGAIHLSRNFYGAQSIVLLDRDDPERARLYYRHGSITHGVQFLAPEFRSVPTTYFTHSSGIGRLLRSFPPGAPLDVGVVGLGAGTLAAYANPGDRVRFYELDPKVVKVARDPFRFLSDCKGRVEIVLGDGRASLEVENNQDFDVLVLDAFSGDAPPVHLLTREAFQTYLRHLKPGGVLAVNVTNVYLDLLSIVAAQARDLGLAGAWVSTPEGVDGIGLKSTWAFVARDAKDLGHPRVLEVAYPLLPEAGDLRSWTDERSAPLAVLRWSP